ncbi:MAG: MoaD/ThiS family protein [Firmicutes bacterium]|nr:MoaD/ThiS family protein [Bacillota bacterium]
MINVKIRFYGYLQIRAGQMEKEASLPEGTTVAQLLFSLNPWPDRAGSEEVRLLDINPENLLVGVNGIRQPLATLAGHILQDGDIVDLLPPLGGG